ncbi:hypothetical protein GCM10007937_39850 [Mesorhizobium albiziae]|nr:hypothetical protein GCM10007937_39850 [Mesorhizobium albiziae]
MASSYEAPRDDKALPVDPTIELLPAAVMKRAHHEKLRLCQALEEIADALPGSVDRRKVLGVANTLVPLLSSIHHYEEAVVFPLYDAVLDASGTRSSTVRRLKAEHVQDECFAGEIAEVFLAIGHGKGGESADAIGFMLRGFFEALRRHIAFEREHILPMIGSSYTG